MLTGVVSALICGRGWALSPSMWMAITTVTMMLVVVTIGIGLGYRRHRYRLDPFDARALSTPLLAVLTVAIAVSGGAYALALL
jgi:hypothetical protein